MLTIYSMPKPFNGHVGIIQRNAIMSWSCLKPRPEIILFGNEEGTAEICEELGLRHGREVARNEFGTPLLDDLFEKVQQPASHNLLCYVNADIILLSDFMRAVERVCHRPRRFLMIGKRWDMDIREPWDFNSDDYDKKLRSLALHSGEQRDAWWIDYFVFPRGLFPSVPPFAIGRTAYDNWLVWNARKRKAAVVDVTSLVIAVHQNHDYSHVKRGENSCKEGGFESVQRSKEAQRNYHLAGGHDHRYNIMDATHRLTPSGVTRNVSIKYLRRRLERFKQRIKGRRRMRSGTGLTANTKDGSPNL